MARKHTTPDKSEHALVEPEGSMLRRAYENARANPVMTLAIAAGIGALMGAEMLAAGFAGGAAVILFQRSDLRERMRRTFHRASERVHEFFDEHEERIEH